MGADDTPKKLSHAIPCQLRHFMKKFNLTESTQKEIYSRFMTQVKKGLARSTHPCADIKCFITYVFALPTGKERGEFLALDLGGSNFRVLAVELHAEDKERVIINKTYEISKEIMTGHGTQLFDYIAACLVSFVKEQKLENQKVPLGFTFSFPCTITSITSAKLVKWTKGFDCEGVIDQDVGRLLNEALQRKGDLAIDFVAVVNDTVGTLMSCAYSHKNTYIGLIVGTGCNACYVEKTENCQRLEPSDRKKHKECIVNCEWGAFGENGDLDFIRTEYDRELDEKAINPGSQIFEKMLSGMYLGELCRLCMKKAVMNNLMFNEISQAFMIEKLSCENMFETKVVSKVERDKYPKYDNTEEVLKTLFSIENPSVDDCYKVMYICQCVSRRSATLVGIGLSGLVNKMQRSKTVIGVDGTLYKKHPKYECYLCKAMKKLVDKKYLYKLVQSEDGSGLGACIIAAVQAHAQEEKKCPGSSS